ncbi:MAG: hypothetical protein AB7G18_13715 [Pyrinomonadaceae bacterium]
MRYFFIIALSVVSAAAAYGQQPSASPPPTPPPTSTPQPTPSPAAPQTSTPSAQDLRRLQQFPLNPVSRSDMLATRVAAHQRLIAPLYRKPSDKELAALRPSESVAVKYSALIRSEDSGVFRLMPEIGCVNNEKVITVKEQCLKYAFPGSGNSYSFRAERYRLRHLADLTFERGKLRITGIFMHGFMTELGEMPIDLVDLATPGMQFLTSFEPSGGPDDVVTKDDSFVSGVVYDRFRYSKSVVPRLNSTYALRAVAYRGRIIRAVGGIMYNELDFDKRRDVIVVFKVVEMDDANGVTIVWKKLADRESPRIRVPKSKDDDEPETSEEAN